MAIAENATELQLNSVIGFSGEVPDGLKYLPCGEYIVYPLGSIIVLRHLQENKQSFLEGHTQGVTCLAVSHDGTRLASGQTHHSGVKADVIVWDLEKAKENCRNGTPSAGGEVVHRLFQHLGKVQAVDFSCDDQFLLTLGGRDDNALVVWEAATGRPICGAPAGADAALCARWLRNRSDRLVTAGNYHLRVWQVDVALPKIQAMDAKLGQMKRVIQCLDVSPDDEVAYCGTKTGDLLRINVNRDDIQGYNDPDAVVPTLQGYSTHRYAKGIKAVRCVLNPQTGNTNVLVGSGDGTLGFMNPALNPVAGKSAALMGGVTSVSLAPDGRGAYVGTDQAMRYYVTLDMDVELRGTCHYGPIMDVVFPVDCPDLFLTCSVNDIRVWNARVRQELLRIQVPNLVCNCVGITDNGGTIVSGWTDGKVRAFFPESGRLKFVITDAHAESVTALAACHEDDSRPPWRLVTGGKDGRVRVWQITSSHQSLLHSMKEHRGEVNCIRVNAQNSQCVTASADGSCIVWDMERYVRVAAMFEPTVFRAVAYHPDESQYLTCGSNHKVTYWDAYDGSAIRVIDGGEEEMVCLDIEPQGELFISGGADKLVKVWHYDDGVEVATGVGHSGRVNALRISPDQRTVVSVGEEGAIMIWDMPDDMQSGEGKSRK
uniref:Cilia- and flagella-associated protein 52 n=2 Tax=Heterosigma akashiwo TaxID=2829 RepID=A0A6V1NYK3_HETAK|mmetsp:Transcript_16340/g.25742  ORF Transcript_16340/g.25742 Transcript_16340/m.25742 type:complete len:656 (+) Transcript_16340:73-2040(+)